MLEQIVEALVQVTTNFCRCGQQVFAALVTLMSSGSQGSVKGEYLYHMFLCAVKGCDHGSVFSTKEIFYAG